MWQQTLGTKLRQLLTETVRGDITMVRSLAQWTKTLSFPARISPNKSSKESVNIHQVSPTVTPTPSNNSLTGQIVKNNELNNMMNNNCSSLTEVNQVSEISRI